MFDSFDVIFEFAVVVRLIAQRCIKCIIATYCYAYHYYCYYYIYIVVNSNLLLWNRCTNFTVVAVGQMMLMTVLPVPHRSCDHLEPGWEPEGQHDLEEMQNMTTNKYLEHSWQYGRIPVRLSLVNSLVSEVKWQMQCNVTSNTTGMRSTRHHRSWKKQTCFLSEVLRYPQLLRKLTQSCHVLVRAKPFLCTSWSSW